MYKLELDIFRKPLTNEADRELFNSICISLLKDFKYDPRYPKRADPNHRFAKVIYFRYCENLTYKEIGKKLGIKRNPSQPACAALVGWMIRKSLRRLRHPKRADLLKHYVGL